MARQFTLLPAPYTGSFVPKPISLCTPMGQNEKPNTVAITIPWATPPYSVTGAVSVDLTVQGAANPIQRIRSIVIDNTAVEWPIYVQFSDTTDLITCLPNSVIRVSVFTNQLACTVFAPDKIAGAVRVTKIFFTNVYLDPLIDYEQSFSIAQWLVTPTDPLAVLPSYAVPALGDKTISLLMNASVGGQTAFLFAKPTGAYIITDFTLWSYGLYRTDFFGNFIIDIKDVTNAITIQEFNMRVGTDFTYMPRQEVFTLRGGQWRLPATSIYAMSLPQPVQAGQSFIELNGLYTWQP